VCRTHNYYWAARKMVRWDSGDEQLALVNLGRYDDTGSPK
jgi:hypothetical protein